MPAARLFVMNLTNSSGMSRRCQQVYDASVQLEQKVKVESIRREIQPIAAQTPPGCLATHIESKEKQLVLLVRC